MTDQNETVEDESSIEYLIWEGEMMAQTIWYHRGRHIDPNEFIKAYAITYVDGAIDMLDAEDQEIWASMKSDLGWA